MKHALAAPLSLVLLAWASPASAADAFERIAIDAAMAGDCKAVGDMDGDGLPDLVVGGAPNEKLVWYQNGSWERHVVAVPRSEFTTDCALGDIDGDGRLDIVVPDGDGQDNLLWFANSPARSAYARWPANVIGSVGDFGKDVKLADFDGDGRLDVAARGHTHAIVFFQREPGKWKKVILPVKSLGGEGMAVGDIDGDGRPDLVFQGVWLRNPGGHAAVSAPWPENAIGGAPTEFKALVGDIDGDGRADVVFSSSEGIADVIWWRQGGPGEPWQPHVVTPNLDRGHTLQTADMDGDGHLDLVIGQMGSSPEKELAVFLNLKGDGTAWERRLVEVGGMHNGVVADVDKDGAPDIFGSDHTGRPPVRLLRNRMHHTAGGPAEAVWRRVHISQHHDATFGLGVGDVDGDGDADVVSGQHVYHNPGGDMTRPWRESHLPGGWSAFTTMDVDGDGRIDILARRPDTDATMLAWLEPHAGMAAHVLGTVPASSHAEGGQGWRVAKLDHAAPSLIVSSGGGIFAFRLPPNPRDRWPRSRVSERPSDEGLAVADVDRDGLMDVIATTGLAKQVEWYRNPGDGARPWTAHAIGEMAEAVFPDRVEAADLDGDGRIDVIVSEENGNGGGAATFWWSQPANLLEPWPRHLLTLQGSTNSMAVADMDGDGRPDIVTGEHRGLHRLITWMNDGRGAFTPREVDHGVETHLGALAHDMDGDGDPDLVGIGWDHPENVWLWRQDRPSSRQAHMVGGRP